MEVRETNNPEAGFSLIELMISLAIFGMVLAGIVAMFTSTGRYHTGQEMMVEVAQNLRTARNLMVDEIRSAGCNPKEQGRMGFLTDSSDDRFNTDANSIHFTRDIDNTANDDVAGGDEFYESDGDTDDANEDISYYRTNDRCRPGEVGTVLGAGELPYQSPPNCPRAEECGCLRRNTGGGGQPVMERVTDLQFQYYDALDTLIDPTSMNTNTELDKIKSVQVTITGQVQNPGRVSTDNQTWTQQFQILVRNR